MANKFINFENTTYTIPNNVLGFEIKYTALGYFPNQIMVIKDSGDDVMTDYKVYADYIFISVNTNESSEQKTEYIVISAEDYSQIITINQKENVGGIRFNVSVSDGIQVVTPSQLFDVNISVSRILTEDIPNYSVRYDLSEADMISFVREAWQPGTLNGLYTFKAGNITSYPISAEANKQQKITIYLEKYIGSGQTTPIQKKEIYLTWSKTSFYLSLDTITFDYLGNPTDKNYVLVYNSTPITDITLSTKSTSETFKFEYRISENYIYITKIYQDYPGSTPFTQLTVNVLVNGSSDVVELTVVKELRKNVYSYPIWKDIFIDLPNNVNYFKIVNIDSGFTIYEGMIYGFITTKIGISDIVRDYMTTVTDPFVNIYTTTSFLNVDVLGSEDGATYKLLYTFNLYYNYAYNDELKFYLDAQVIDYYDPRQYLLFTALDINHNGIDTLSVDGISYIIRPDYNQQTIAIPANFKDKHIVHTYVNRKEEDITYYSKCTNTNYAVYYLNRYGGWSWMLFNGRNIQTDKTTHNVFSVTFDNNIGTDYQSKIYQNDILESWSLTTDYLTDKQSELLKHLYSSPLVYLHDLNTDKVISVLVDTKSFDYKTYKNQGRKMFTHTIKVNSSQTKIIL